MSLTNSKSKLLSLIIIALLATAGLLGCGLRDSHTGSLSSRIVNADGDAIQGAKVFSIFDEARQVYTDSSGGFYLAELPAGNNNIVIIHPDYAVEKRQVNIKPDDTTVIESIKLDKANAPDRISNVRVKLVGSTTATITWNTYKSVICNIDYGISRSYGSLYREQRNSTIHEATLTGLSSEMLYHFRVQYVDEDAKSHYSYDYSFKTTQGDRPSAPVSVSIASFTQLEVVRIEWAPATSPSTVGYNIFRREKNQEWNKITDVPVSPTSRYYEDLNAESGVFWQYAVSSVNDRGANSELTASKVIFTPGIMTRDTEITTDESPVILTSDLVIAAGVNLIIDPGVEFEIADSDSMQTGLDDKRVEIIVHGRIAINGTKDNPVAFKPLDGSGKRDHWQGISILSDKTGISQLNYLSMFGCAGYAIEVEANKFKASNLHIKYCENGIKLSGINDYLTLENSTIEEIASEALFIKNCRRIVLSDSSIKDVGTGVRIFTSDSDDSTEIKTTYISATNVGVRGIIGKSKFINNLILAKTGIGILANNYLNTNSNYIDHCTIDALNGIKIESGNVTIENNIIANTALSGTTGIENSSVLVPSYSYNSVYGFTTAYVGCGSAQGGVTTDPEFVGGHPYDYNLKPTSVLRLQDKYGNQLGRYGPSRL